MEILDPILDKLYSSPLIGGSEIIPRETLTNLFADVSNYEDLEGSFKLYKLNSSGQVQYGSTIPEFNTISTDNYSYYMLGIDTECITIAGDTSPLRLGKYIIGFKLEEFVRPDYYSYIYAWAHETNKFRRNYKPHPHISHYYGVCYGEADGPIRRAGKRRQIDYQFTTLLSILKTYNRASPHSRIENFRPVTHRCYDCTELHDIDDLNRCFSCFNYACNNCKLVKCEVEGCTHQICARCYNIDYLTSKIMCNRCKVVKSFTLDKSPYGLITTVSSSEQIKNQTPAERRRFYKRIVEENPSSYSTSFVYNPDGTVKATKKTFAKGKDINVYYSKLG